MIVGKFTTQEYGVLSIACESVSIIPRFMNSIPEDFLILGDYQKISIFQRHGQRQREKQSWLYEDLLLRKASC